MSEALGVVLVIGGTLVLIVGMENVTFAPQAMFPEMYLYPGVIKLLTGGVLIVLGLWLA